MKIEVKKVSSTHREIQFEIPKDRVSQKMDQVYQEIGKVAKIKGFRPGKVPRHVLESQHGKAAQRETIEQLIPEAYQEGIQKENLHPIDMPEILDVNFKDGMITFKAKLDIKPEVKLKDYKGIKVKRKSAQVTEEDLNKTLEYFKQAQGKDEKQVVLDDTFARGLGYPTLDEFKKVLSKQLEMEKDRQNRVDVENQIVDELLKRAKLDVPQGLAKKQLEKRLEDILKRMKAQGMKEEDLKKKEEELRKELKPVVEHDVKAYLIFDHIAHEEKITVKEGESIPAKVMEFLLKEAKWEETK